MLADFIMLFSR